MTALAPTATATLNPIIKIPVKLIFIPEDRKKQFNKDKEENRNFLHSLERTKELINPINVRPIVDEKKGGRYELVCGRRRLWAAKQLGWETIACKVEAWTDRQIGWMRTTENIHRHQMSAIELTKAHVELMAEFERCFGKDPGRGASNISWTDRATRNSAGEFVKGAPNGEQPKDPNFPPPSTAFDAVDGEQQELVEPPAAGEKAFVSLLAEVTGRASRTSADDMLILKRITAEDIRVLEFRDVTRKDLLQLARIEDDVTRGRAMSLISGGLAVAQAIERALATPEQDVQIKAKVAEDNLTDEQWLETWCGSFRKGLQDTTKFDRDALLYRESRPIRSVFRGKGQKMVLAHKDKGYSPFLSLVSRMMFTAHPNDWNFCHVCMGKNKTYPECSECRGCGYTLTKEVPRPRKAR